MPETMSPREKVEPCFECGSTERIGSACAPCNPELAALASSGDHAELLRMALQDSHELARRGLNPDVRLNEAERSAITALIAENAALREKWTEADALASNHFVALREKQDDAQMLYHRATEAERKLAEAVEVIERLGSSEAFDMPRAIDGPLAAEMRARMDYARTFLSSKEAERG